MRKLVNNSRYLLRNVDANDKCSVSFSGGKDSLVALDLSIRAGIEEAVYCNTTVGFDDTEQYMEVIKAFYGIKIDIIEPAKKFFDLVNTIGFPSRRLRWCCEVLKFSPLATYVLKHGITALITGLRKEESFRRKNYTTIDKNPLIPAQQINPLINWTENDIQQYISDFNLPLNPVYDLGFKRSGCWICPYQTKSDWAMVEKIYPEKINYLQNTLKMTIKNNGSLGIRDIDDYVKNYGWVKNAYPQVSNIMGSIEEQNGGFIISFNRRDDVKKVQNMIIILTKDVVINENSISTTNIELPRLKRLVEKAINCIGCGACLAMCRHQALHLKNGQITVKTSDCVSCGDCLNAGLLRGACVRRNYAPIRLEMKCNSVETDEFTIRVISRLCNGEKIGLIRTIKDLNEVHNLNTLGKLFPLKNGIFVKNDEFTAVFKKEKQFLEILVKTKERDLDEVLFSIRKFLVNNGELVS